MNTATMDDDRDNKNAQVKGEEGSRYSSVASTLTTALSLTSGCHTNKNWENKPASNNKNTQGIPTTIQKFEGTNPSLIGKIFLIGSN